VTFDPGVLRFREVVFIDNIVSAEYAICFPAAYLHYYVAVHASASHISGTSPPEVVNQQAGYARCFRGVCPRLTEISLFSVFAGKDVIVLTLAFAASFEQFKSLLRHLDCAAISVLGVLNRNGTVFQNRATGRAYFPAVRLDANRTNNRFRRWSGAKVQSSPFPLPGRRTDDP